VSARPGDPVRRAGIFDGGGAMQRYLHYLRTGSGSDCVEIQLDDDVAVIAIRRHWMGMGLKRYRLACRHGALSDCYGRLTVERAEAAAGEDEPFEVIAFDDEEGILLPLVIEYLTVPRSPVHVPEHSQLTMMRPLGYATWNDSFELALMVYDFEGRAQGPTLSDICDALDKKKFALWSEEMEAERAARDRADSEASRDLWGSILRGQRS
jgi:hypothetical protein